MELQSIRLCQLGQPLRQNRAVKIEWQMSLTLLSSPQLSLAQLLGLDIDIAMATSAESPKINKGKQKCSLQSPTTIEQKNRNSVRQASLAWNPI